MRGTDPSLAAGLTKRFIREQPKKHRKLFNFVKHRWPAASDSKKRWAKFVHDIQKHDSALTNSYLGGSPKKPYLCMDIIKTGDWNAMFTDYEKGWDEPCLVINRQILSFRPTDLRERNYSLPVAFTVSHHAISRLIERTLTFGADYDLLNEQIRGEMKYIGLWSSMWRYLTIRSGFEFNDPDLDFLIPSEHGIFLAKYYRHTLFVRTYYDEGMLPQERLEIRNTLLSVSDGFISSPLSFFPDLEVTDREHSSASYMIVQLLLHRLRNHIQTIVEEITRRSKSDESKNALLDEINSFVNELGLSVDDWDGIDELTRGDGLNRFLIEVRKHRES